MSCAMFDQLKINFILSQIFIECLRGSGTILGAGNTMASEVDSVPHLLQQRLYKVKGGKPVTM